MQSAGAFCACFYDFASDSDRSAAILLWRACGEDECGGKRSDPGKTGTE